MQGARERYQGVASIALPAAIGALALIVWYGPATPSFALVGLLRAPDPEVDSDIALYLYYAGLIADGAIPYRDVFVEYPPLSLPLISAPYAFGTELGSYRSAFEAIIGAIAAAAAVATLLAARHAGCNRKTQVAAGGLVAVGPLLVGHTFAADRLDFLPVLFVALAALAAARAREGLAGCFAGLGAAAKLWPGVMAVPLAALALRRDGLAGAKRAGIGFCLGLGVPYALGALASPAGIFDSIQFQTNRPLQVEASGATLLVLLDRLGVGPAVAAEGSFESRSVNLVGGGTEAVAIVGTLLGAAVVLVLSFAGARRIVAARTQLEAFELAMVTALAATVALILFGKVLSPQFVLWLLPLPLLVGQRLRWIAGGLVALALLLTNLAFAAHDAYADDHELGATLLYGARGLVLLTLLGILAASLRLRSSATAADPRGATEAT